MRPTLNFFFLGLGKRLRGKAEHILRLPSCIFFYCWGLPTAGAEGYCSRKAIHWREVGKEDRRHNREDGGVDQYHSNTTSNGEGRDTAQ